MHGDEEAGFLIFDNFGITVDIGGDDGLLHHGGVEEREGEAFMVGRKDEDA